MTNYAEDRNKAIAWAKNILQEQDTWLILDTETTGLYKAEIVQIGIINLEEETILNSLIKPTVPIPRNATRIHKITDNIVADAPGFPDIYPQFIEIIKGKKILIYNKEFDCRIIDYCCLLHDLEVPKLFLQSECLMRKYAPYYGAWNHRRKSYTWQPLRGGDHSAIGDCRASLKLLNKMANSNYEET